MSPFAEASALVDREVFHSKPQAPFDSTVLNLCIALIVLSTLFAATRVITRAFVLKAFGVDDVFCVLAWVAITAQLAFFIHVQSFGAQQTKPTPTQVKNRFVLVFVLEALGLWVYLFLKTAFFLTYLRIFGPDTTMRRLIYAGMAVCIAFYLAEFFYIVFRCDPIAASWDSAIKGKCITESQPGVGVSTFNIITDLYILILPMPMVFHLHTTKKRKAKLFAIFSIGIFTVAASVVRLYETIQRNNNAAVSPISRLNNWTNTEYSVGLMVVSALVFPAFWDHVLREPLDRYWSHVSSAYQSVLSSRSGGRLQSEVSMEGRSTGPLEKVSSHPHKEGFREEYRSV